jgi:hypothetical protein
MIIVIVVKGGCVMNVFEKYDASKVIRSVVVDQDQLAVGEPSLGELPVELLEDSEDADLIKSVKEYMEERQ